MVAIHSIPEEVVRLAIADPMTMIASDGILDHGKGHPRAAGTCARVLGRYVREQYALMLMDAVRKMTVMPADRLGIRTKGRIAVGADADITVFDPARVIDRATFENPAQYSEGIAYVLVNGTLVVKGGELVEGVAPGLAVRREGCGAGLQSSGRRPRRPERVLEDWRRPGGLPHTSFTSPAKCRRRTGGSNSHQYSASA